MYIFFGVSAYAHAHSACTHVCVSVRDKMKEKVKLMRIVMCIIMQEFNFLHKTIETLML